MYQNATITITPHLWFEETLLGATLNCRSSDGPDAVLFRVGMSFLSLVDCYRSLSRPACLWTIRDGSLSVFGDFEELTLTFCAVDGTLIQIGLSLIGEELRLFKNAMNALAFRKEYALN
jgi:hypothetical protein